MINLHTPLSLNPPGISPLRLLKMESSDQAKQDVSSHTEVDSNQQETQMEDASTEIEVALRAATREGSSKPSKGNTNIAWVETKDETTK